MRRSFDPKTNKLGAPLFLPRPQNVTVNTGEQAVLQCAISNLGTKTVSWLKKSPKQHPLTVGTYTFIEDANISVVHNNQTHEWNLLIKDVQISHSGVYECQVSSSNKLSRLVRLTVKDGVSKPSVHISGTGYVENTKSIEIICNATSGGRPPKEITWFKDGEIITSETNNERIQIKSDVHTVARALISKLVIQRSHLDDAGIYVCRTSDLKATEFKVHVLNTYDVVVVRIADPVKLQCNITARHKNPPATAILWFKQDKLFKPNSKAKIFINHYPLQPQGTLLSVFSIIHAKYEDSGVYSCKTSNYNEIRRFKVEVIGSNGQENGSSFLSKLAIDNTSASVRRRHNDGGHNNYNDKRSEESNFSPRLLPFSLFCVLLTQVICWGLIKFIS
ncbi:hemicentin-1 [Octopus sinensis]|uniref:Hemicentin-1 n=1 Tax=Octopus sinensis TaxID=2607531 RepID=A0A7E6F864_9MOLL|nr:hemicentin-1 [Octopus sinensis]